MCALAKESELMKYGWKADMHVWIISCCCFNHIHNMFSNVKGVIVDYTKRLILGICITLLLLCLCMTIDYADDGISNLNASSLNKTMVKGAILGNN